MLFTRGSCDRAQPSGCQTAASALPPVAPVPSTPLRREARRRSSSRRRASALRATSRGAAHQNRCSSPARRRHPTRAHPRGGAAAGGDSRAERGAEGERGRVRGVVGGRGFLLGSTQQNARSSESRRKRTHRFRRKHALHKRRLNRVVVTTPAAHSTLRVRANRRRSAPYRSESRHDLVFFSVSKT